MTNCKVVVNHAVELTEEEKEQARQDAMNRLRDEVIASALAKQEMAKMRKPIGVSETSGFCSKSNSVRMISRR